MYLIETELLQAIGRARLVWENATVTVLSNFPVVGAEIKSVREWRELVMISKNSGMAPDY